MLFPDAEAPPDLWPTTLDEIFAVRVLVDPQVDNFFSPVAATVSLNEAIKRRFDLKLPLYTVLRRQVKKHVAMHDLGLPVRQTLKGPRCSERNTSAPQPF